MKVLAERNTLIVWCLKDNLPSIEFYKAMGGIVMYERDFEIDDKIYKEVGIMYKFFRTVHFLLSGL